MNSVILSVICGFFTRIADFYKESVLCACIDKIYKKASSLWSSSRIVTRFGEKREETIFKSVLSKIIYCPFSALEYINKKIGARLSSAIEKSAILSLGRGIVNNILALNTRFLGAMFLGMLLASELISFRFSAITAIFAVFGILLVLVNYNITDFFAGSKVIRWGMSVIGFPDISWKIYDNGSIGKTPALIMAVLLGAISGILPLKIGILLPIAVTAVGAVLIYPVAGVFFAIFAAPFVPTMILAGICVLTFGSLLVKSLTEEGFIWKRDALGVGLGFFLVFMLVSCLFSFSAKKSILVWGMYLIFVGFYFVIINTVKTKEQLYALLKVFVIAGLFVSLYGVLQYIFGWNTTNAWIDEEMFEEATMRAYSTMENPNVLGEYLLLLIPLAAVFFLKRGSGAWERVFYIGVFLVGALCMIFTQSRGCWLGLILAAAVFVTFYNGRLWALFPLALAALVFLMPQTMIDRMMSVGNLEDSSTSYRVFIWLGTLEMMKDFWIGGIGMGEGAFRSVYPLYSYNGIIAPHSHNTFLQLLVEGGIGALLTFVAVMVAFLRNMASVFRKSEKGSCDALAALATGSAVLGFLLQSMFDYSFYNYRMMAMFFMVLALGTSLKTIKEEHDV